MLTNYPDSFSASETIDGSALSFEGVDDVHCCHGFSSGVLSVGYCVSHDPFQESFQHLSGVVVNERGDSLDASSSGQSSDCWLGDPFNRSLVASLLGDSLGSHFTFSSDSFSAFALSGSCH